MRHRLLGIVFFFEILAYCSFGQAVFTPEQFGGVGNGLLDDAISIQKAIDAAPIGGKLLFTTGKSYLLKSQLTIQKPLIIDGANATLINDISGTANTFLINSCSQVQFQNLTFTLNYTPSNASVKGHLLFYKASNCRVENCVFLKSNWYAIQIRGEESAKSEQIVIQHCQIKELAHEGGDGNSPTGIYVNNYSEHISISHNQLDGSGAVGICILNEGGGGTIQDVLVSQNHIANKDTYGIVIYDTFQQQKVTDIQVVSNSIENINGALGVKGNAGAGIYLASCERCVIDKNSIKRTNLGTIGLSLTPAGIGINTCKHVLITNNIISDCQYHGISLKNAESITCTGNQIIAPRHIALEIWNCKQVICNANQVNSSVFTEQCLYIKSSIAVLINNNIVWSKGRYHVIHLDGDGANHQLQITNNFVAYNGTTDQLVFTSNGTNTQVICTGNTFQNASSSAAKRVAYFNNMTDSELTLNHFVGRQGSPAVFTEGNCLGSTFFDNYTSGDYAISATTQGLVFTLPGDKPPTRQGYGIGSKILNNSPSTKESPAGWILTTQGVWKAFY
ncbi:MAG: right-handed parallel beta-helix repeat-containing protein [Spirosomataceae bacterium]